MTDEYKLPQDKMLFSVDELKEAGFSHYKINQMVEKGVLLKLIQIIRVKNRTFTMFLHMHPKV